MGEVIRVHGNTEMAETAEGKKPFLNDQQLKELIRTEEKKKTIWEKKWGFLDHEAEKQIYREEAVKLSLQADFFETRKKKMQAESDIKITSSPPAPTTMSQFVGWRSRPEHSLEICGPLYVSPKLKLKKQDGPQDYNNIFLG